MEAIQIDHEILVEPRPENALHSQRNVKEIGKSSITDYFCVHGTSSTKGYREIQSINGNSASFDVGANHHPHHQETSLKFAVVSTTKEIVLLLHPFPVEGIDGQSSNLSDERFYKLVIGGGDENDLSWLSIVNNKNGFITKLHTVFSPHVVKEGEMHNFWLRLRKHNSVINAENKNSNRVFPDAFISESLMLEFGKGSIATAPILSWPVQPNFQLRNIDVPKLEGHHNNIR